MPAPFTGRDAERRLIAAVLGRVRGGRPSVVVFVGVAGVGKSRLLREIVVPADVRRLEMVGYEPEASIPLAAASNLLRQLAVAPVDSRSGLTRPDSELLHVFEATFAALDPRRPTVLAVDDLQWLDSASAALLHYLIRGAVAGGVPLAVLAAARPGPESAPSIEALERLLGDTEVLTIHELRPLDESDAIRLVRAAAPSLPVEDAQRIWHRVGGSPYWLLALAQTIGPDPTDALRERLDRLSPDAATLLGLLAVAARPTSTDTAATLLAWPVERVADAARELRRTGLGAEAPDGFRPVHDLVREAVAATLPEETRREHHRRLAAGYEQEAGDDVQRLAAALTHRTAAGDPAVDLALRVATAERRRWLGPDGLAALIRVTDAADDRDGQLPTLRREVASLATELGISDVALARWRPLVEVGSLTEQAEARLAAAHEAYRLGDADELRVLLRPPAAWSWDPVQAVEVLALEASSLLWVESRSADGKALAPRVLEAGRRLAAEPPSGADPARVGRAYRAAVKVAFEAGMQAENWQGLRELAAEYVEATSRLDGRARIEALLYESTAIRFEGAPGSRQASVVRCREALALARRDLLPDLMIEAGHFLAQALYSLGALAEAEQMAAETADLAERVGDYSKLRARPKSLLWEIRVSAGPWREALANFEAQAPGLEPHFRLAQYQTAASLVSRIQGRAGATRVEELVGMSLADAETAGCDRCRREAQVINAVSLARVGRLKRAEELLAAADDSSRPEPYVERMRAWARALLDARPSDRLPAVSEAFRRSGHNLDALWARIDVGRSLAKLDPTGAADVLREAGREAATFGARTQVHVADQLLRTLGQRTWRRTAAAAAASDLTEREREVAELIAGGATNLEIAESLFVSVKTVERHVSNLLAKYDARNRTELAQRWSTRQP